MTRFHSLKHLNQWIITLCLVFAISSAWATLDLTLTEGQNKQTTLVFAPIKDKTSTQEKTQAEKILHQDLKRSGHFLIYQSTAENTQHADYIVNMQVKRNKKSGWMIQSNFSNDALQGKPALIVTTQTQNTSLRQSIHAHSDQLIQQWTQQPSINQTQIAYVLKTEAKDNKPTYRLMIADVDGQHTHPILTSKKPILSPRFAQKSPYIAYVSFEYDHPVIYIHNLKQQTRRLISNYPGINSAPAWRYDDQALIVALSFKKQTPSLYEIDRQHGHIKRLTQGNYLDTEPYMTHNPNAVWFTSNRAGRPHIFKLNRKTHHVTQVTQQGQYHSKPSISENEKTLITLDRAKGVYQLNQHDLTQQQSHTLAQATRMEGAALAPQTNLILYAKTLHAQHSQLAIMDFKGHTTAIIPTPKGLIQDPAWQSGQAFEKK